jgi:hypothetical protein
VLLSDGVGWIAFFEIFFFWKSDSTESLPLPARFSPARIFIL